MVLHLLFLFNRFVETFGIVRYDYAGHLFDITGMRTTNLAHLPPSRRECSIQSLFIFSSVWWSEGSEGASVRTSDVGISCINCTVRSALYRTDKPTSKSQVLRPLKRNGVLTLPRFATRPLRMGHCHRYLFGEPRHDPHGFARYVDHSKTSRNRRGL